MLARSQLKIALAMAVGFSKLLEMSDKVKVLVDWETSQKDRNPRPTRPRPAM